MHYNISFDVISLVVLLILTCKFFTLKRYPILSNRIFCGVLFLAIINIIFDVFGSLSVNEGSVIPFWMIYPLNALYYVTEIVLPATIFVYTIALMAKQKYIPKWNYILGALPSLAFLVVMLTGMILGKVFTINPDRTFNYGPLSVLTYACTGVYMVGIIILILVKGKLLSSKERFSLWFLIVFVALAASFQYFFPNLLLSGSAVALSFLLMYLVIQDPQLMTDTNTGLFSVTAFEQLIGMQLYEKKRFHIAAFKMHSLHNIYLLNGRETGDLALEQIGHDVLSTKNGLGFRISDAVFAISFRNLHDLENFVMKFDSNRKKPMQYGRMEYIPEMTLVCIRDAERLKTTGELLSVIENSLDDKNVVDIRNKTVLLCSDDIENCRRQIIIENEIRQELTDGKNFQMYYQPIYSLKDSQFTTAEALVRYRSEKLGRISPSEFVPLIEEKGLSQQFDELIVRKVFSEIESGAFRGMSLKNIHINLSAASFSSVRFINKCITMAENYDIDPTFIVFEITETAAAISDINLESSAEKIRAAHFGFALDDFGSGYANIRRMSRLPFTAVKLDKDLVQDSTNHLIDYVNLFRPYQMAIVAEGVETVEQLNAVKEAGVDLVQGYYYAKPMSIEDLSDLMKQ